MRMASIVPAVIAGLAAGIILIAAMAYPYTSNTLYEKLNVGVYPRSSNVHYLTDDVVRKSVNAALTQEITKDFISEFSNNGISTRVRYVTADEIIYSEQLPFPPDTDVIVIFFGSPRGLVPEFPMLSVYIEPKTYHVFGTHKDFWT